MALMMGLAVLGFGLLVAAPLLARIVIGKTGDPVGVARILRGIGIALLFLSLLARPHREDTAAFPPPPDMRQEP